ncbi:MAG: thiol peroxidase [Planctomycetota bacterium]|mgnify:FL=1|jgi:thiol peroxidase|nr:thiol peroxidase [Planctomycetota bacterium]MEC7499492.1 thiol peroxidase [Planctomycetota bacterium]MEC7717560.1 thiol peroxidase [Planctomycetota bacterium]MEC8241571.1 thiol peroxidase [Planctomycetota bacterium]MEC8303265.1 thiol peroxidase [Planctomycetota bacterium]
MQRQENGVTFKGSPMTLLGESLKVGQNAPEFNLHYYEGGLKSLTLDDLKGKPSLVSVVPSLDTKVCAIQTQRFQQDLADLAGQINALTVSLDLPFAQGRFCGENEITMSTASDYQDRSLGLHWGLLIDELKLLARAVVVLDSDGKVVHVEVVPEVASEPDYDAALTALKSQLA